MTRKKSLLDGLLSILFVLPSRQEAQTCSLKGNSTTMLSIIEDMCPSSSHRFFKINVSPPGADEVFTSILSPKNATCIGFGSNFVCTASPDHIVAYNVYTAAGCLPNEQNNNFADTSIRFSKQIVVCKPCPPGDYWIALKPLSPNMSCSFKMFIPRLRCVSSFAPLTGLAQPSRPSAHPAVRSSSRRSRSLPHCA